MAKTKLVRKTPKKKKVGTSRQGNLTVISEALVPIDSLQPYYKNPRIGDVEKVAESLRENGQFRSIVVNIGTLTGRKNEILAGNHTFKAAKKLKWTEIYVGWVDVDNQTARKIVLADNGSADGSTYDESILAGLLSDIKKDGGSLIGTTYTDDILSKLIKEDKKDPLSEIDLIEDAPDVMEGVADLANGIVFPSDLPYDIPKIRIDMIPEPEEIGNLDVFSGHEIDGRDVRKDYDETWWLAVWHAGCRGINWKQSIACFYTDDFHFDPVYNDPAKNTKKILNLQMPMAIMPNYTISVDMPIALWVYAAYRSFYVARYFQEAGIKVIPDIQTGGDDAVLDVALLGIPEGAPLVAAQAQMARGDKEFIRQKARLLKEAEDRVGFKNIIIYGHTDADEVVERANFDANVIRVANRTSRRREYLNSGATINTQQVKVKKRKVVKKK